MSRPEVVLFKVGGSLLDWPELPHRLRTTLERHESQGGRSVLMVGGGPVADWARGADRLFGLGEEAAHHLALRALDVTAMALELLVAPALVVAGPKQLEGAWASGRRPIINARLFLAEDERTATAPLPRSWSVTSDSIAARAAERSGAVLRLLKSADLPPGTDLASAARLGLVDPAFPGAAGPLGAVQWENLRTGRTGDLVP